jgi:hypothetical protein
MDAGIGETMAISALIGAGVGGASSAIQGKDPLKGALIGGVGGAATGGAMGAFSGAGASAVTDPVTQQLVSTELANVTPQVAEQTIGKEATNQILTNGGADGISQFVPPPTPSGGIDNLSQVTGPTTFERALDNTVNPPLQNPGTFGEGFMKGLNEYKTPAIAGALGIGALSLMNSDKKKFGVPPTEHYTGPLSKFNYDPNNFTPTYPTPPNPPYRAQYAAGGITQLPQDKNYAAGGMYPGSQIDKTQYAESPQTPMSMQATMASYDPETNPLTGEPTTHMAKGGIAGLLKGRGDGMSDSIHATIANKQPARLADGEFVIPADVVSHLGNGSTDAGAKHLYKMMDKVRHARTGSKKQGKQIAAGGYLPA